VYLGFYAVLAEELLREKGIAGSQLFSLQVFNTIVVLVAGNGNGQPAFAKAKRPHDLHVLAFLIKNILAHDPNVRNTILHILRDIVITKEIDLHREVIRSRFEQVAPVLDGNATIVQELDAVLGQPTGLLYSELQVHN
jgi:hypothetical protein